MFIKVIRTIIMLAFSCVVFAEADMAEELGKMLQATQSIKADFSQKVYDNKGQLLREVTGNMALKKPKLFRWQVSTPEPSLIVIDGKKIWNYDEELQQVTVQDMEENYASSPVGLFLTANIHDISKKYVVNKVAIANIKQIATKAETNCFKLIPKKTADGFKKVELIFKSGIIDSLVLVDQLEQTSKIRFSNVQANITLAAELFTFTPPAGADVVGNN